MANTGINYNEAVKELENILYELENNPDIDIDSIAGKVRRATELIGYCRKQLKTLDKQLAEELDKIDTD